MAECVNDTFLSFHDDYVLPTVWLPDCVSNDTNTTRPSDTAEDDVLVTVIVGIVLALVILVTVVGNVLVISAVIVRRELQSPQNYLILSLAVADCLVACLVMPLGAVYEVSGSWRLGEWGCIIWTTSDVLACTASILHLLAIAADRYWSVTNIDYMHRRNNSRVLIMIFAVWMLSVVICLAQLGWKDETWKSRIEDKQCIVNQDLYFQIFATSASFWLPLSFILYLYFKIFQAARKRIRKRRGPTAFLPRPQCPAAETSLITTASSSNPSPEKAVLINNYGGIRRESGSEDSPCRSVPGSSETPRKGPLHHQLLPPGSPANSGTGVTPDATPAKRIKTPKESGESKREKKAAKTLAIITGVFIISWTPFFIMAITLPICGEHCEISRYTVSLIQWLGYINSTLNPVIYTIFSPEFRLAFKKILGLSTRKPNRAVAV